MLQNRPTLRLPNRFFKFAVNDPKLFSRIHLRSLIYKMATRASNARFIMQLAGIPDTEPIPLYMLYKVNGTQVIENRKIGEKGNDDE